MACKSREGHKKPQNNQHQQLDCAETCNRTIPQWNKHQRPPAPQNQQITAAHRLLSHIARTAVPLGCSPEKLSAVRSLSKADHRSMDLQPDSTGGSRRPKLEGCNGCWEVRRSQIDLNDHTTTPAARQ